MGLLVWDQPAAMWFSLSLLLSFLKFTLSNFASPAGGTFNSGADVSIPGYTYQGCYTEAIDTRALSNDAFFDDDLTIEKCAADCGAYLWFGVEYGRECYCGNSPNEGSDPAPASDCYFPCPGNSMEICGAGDRLNMYSRSTIAPLTPPISQPYSKIGCYTDSFDQRALKELSYFDNAMTVGKCGTVCLGYAFFGV